MIISNSNIDTYQSCEMRAFFSYKLALQPVESNVAISMGVLGHSLMELYFQAIIEGQTRSEATAIITEKAFTSLTNQFDVNKTLSLATNMISWIEDHHWTPVAAEQTFKIDLPNGHTFAMTVDGIFRRESGIKKGSLVLVDYKFTGQYWTDNEVNVAQQVTKYAAYLNKYKFYNIKDVAYMMANTRSNLKDPDKMLKIKWAPYSEERANRIIEENEKLMDRYAQFYNNVTMKTALHAVKPYVCKICPFAKDICPMDLDGKSLDRTIEINYEPNEYSYE